MKNKTPLLPIETCIQHLLQYIGEDPTREGLRETPLRVAQSYGELFSGYQMDPQKILKKFTNENYDEMILIRNIEYFSMCEHHMMPFFGTAHIAYIPGVHITGLSKIPRLVDAFARRLQNQERLTVQIAEALFTHLKPKGVATQMSGMHLCMSARGVQKSHAETLSSCFLGVFKKDASLRADFFAQI